MSKERFHVGEHFLNLASVAAAHWEGDKLFLHFEGGRFLSLFGDHGQLVWRALLATSQSLTPELVDRLESES